MSGWLPHLNQKTPLSGAGEKYVFKALCSLSPRLIKEERNSLVAVRYRRRPCFGKGAENILPSTSRNQTSFSELKKLHSQQSGKPLTEPGSTVISRGSHCIMSNGDSDEKAQKEMLSNIQSPQMNPPNNHPGSWRTGKPIPNLSIGDRGIKELGRAAAGDDDGTRVPGRR